MKTLDINTQAKDKAFIKLVLSHYKKFGRHDLVWRKKITPYKILVSEIMLQQTQVPRVLPKFALWIKEYPSLARLGKSSLGAILSLWQGLGYQRRAKALFEVARAVSKLPKRYEELLKLPGIGPYTASAIMAFAHDEFPPHLLETNIRTALIEHFHSRKKIINDAVLYKDLARLASYREVQKTGARNWYYALMDYGAHLKANNISHNAKSASYAKQSPYKGSVRELRAKTLFAIAQQQNLPKDNRLNAVLISLMKEGYITRKGRKYAIA